MMLIVIMGAERNWYEGKFATKKTNETKRI